MIGNKRTADNNSHLALQYIPVIQIAVILQFEAKQRLQRERSFIEYRGDYSSIGISVCLGGKD